MKAMKNLRELEAVEGLRYGEKNGKISPAKEKSDPRKYRLPEVRYLPQQQHTWKGTRKQSEHQRHCSIKLSGNTLLASRPTVSTFFFFYKIILYIINACAL